MAADVLIVAGGTGGHVYPAMALALYLIKEDKKVIFLTDRRGIIYLKPHLDVLHPVVLPLDRRGAGVGGLLKLAYQVIQSFFRRRTLYVHEQNAVLGKVNRLLSPFLQKIFTSTKKVAQVPKGARSKIEFVGMPVRGDIAALSKDIYKKPERIINLLIVGGSQGAQSFSHVIPKAIGLLSEDLQKRLCITHQVRKEDHNHALALYEQQAKQVKWLTLVPFVEDMAASLKKTHLVISRSGASTVAEISAAGRPAIMIPYPFATDDHQRANALEVTAIGGGWLLPQQDFTPLNLGTLLGELLAEKDGFEKLLVAAQCVKGGYKKEAIKALAQKLILV